jgi:hypothetical protein
MGITPRFNQNDINRQIQNAKNQIDERIIGILKYTGEMSIKVAREEGSYRDVTGNLRSSIGYVIYAGGRKVAETFEMANGGTGKGKSAAIATARAYASGIAEKWSGDNDYVLVVVAGMNYASSVESRGLNVLVTAEQYAESALPRLISALNTKLK